MNIETIDDVRQAYSDSRAQLAGLRGRGVRPGEREGLAAFVRACAAAIADYDARFTTNEHTKQ